MKCRILGNPFTGQPTDQQSTQSANQPGNRISKIELRERFGDKQKARDNWIQRWQPHNCSPEHSDVAP